MFKPIPTPPEPKEELSYRTIAKIDAYREDGLDGIRSKRQNADRKVESQIYKLLQKPVL